jgi:hypothetical protein
VLANAEAYAEPLQAIERLGRFLKPKAQSLKAMKLALQRVAAESALATDLPGEWPAFHPPFMDLYEAVSRGRNDAMHMGARARHLTTHAVQLCEILEDALQQGLDNVSAFMVTEVITVERWQPVSLMRHRMLQHSFTFMPVEPEEQGGSWRLVSDHQLALFLGKGDRKQRLTMSIGKALAGDLDSSAAAFLEATDTISEALERLRDRPFLVRSGAAPVVGIVTAFDLL